MTDHDAPRVPLYYVLTPVYDPPTGMRPVGYMTCMACRRTVGDSHGEVLCLICADLVCGHGPLRDLLREESRRVRSEPRGEMASETRRADEAETEVRRLSEALVTEDGRSVTEALASAERLVALLSKRAEEAGKRAEGASRGWPEADAYRDGLEWVEEQAEELLSRRDEGPL